MRHRLLAAVAGLDDTVLAQALRAAVDGNVLVVEEDGYAFRHPLIREAVYEDHSAWPDAAEAPRRRTS